MAADGLSPRHRGKVLKEGPQGVRPGPRHFHQGRLRLHRQFSMPPTAPGRTPGPACRDRTRPWVFVKAAAWSFAWGAGGEQNRVRIVHCGKESNLIHSHIERNQAPDATSEERRTATCGLVLPEGWYLPGQSRERLYTHSERSRREAVVSDDLEGLIAWYRRYCVGCFPDMPAHVEELKQEGGKARRKASW